MKKEKPNSRFSVLTRRDAPKLICLLSSQGSVLCSGFCPLISVFCLLFSVF
ncbi:MAG: hypothetical protein LBD06_03940 [Candidatus Accumulibacter sp.]|nr:hypothetical protein [Accumulibacter sp.]